MVDIRKGRHGKISIIKDGERAAGADPGCSQMTSPEIDQDEFETVVNSQNTYKKLAETLGTSGTDDDPNCPVVFAWTDGEGTQLDILMAYRPAQFGHLQRGMNALTDLFVAISSFGMFGFELNGIEKDAGYVGEKLNLGGTNTTTEKLAELINGVCVELEK